MPAKRPPSPKEAIKVRSRFKPGQTVMVRAKIRQIRADDLGRPQLVVELPHGMAPVRLREEDAEPSE